MKIYLDIETIPGPDKPTPESIKAPENYKNPDTIKAYQLAHVESEWRKQSLNSMLGRVVCIGAAADTGGVVTFCGPDEREIFIRFGAWLQKNTPAKGGFDFVGHNVAAFDLLWVWRRAVKYRLPFLSSSIRLERYRGNYEDTMMLWAASDPYNGKVSLNALAEYLGLGSKSGDGSQVFGMWQAGDYPAIAAYCADDVALVRKVYQTIAP